MCDSALHHSRTLFLRSPLCLHTQADPHQGPWEKDWPAEAPSRPRGALWSYPAWPGTAAPPLLPAVSARGWPPPAPGRETEPPSLLSLGSGCCPGLAASRPASWGEGAGRHQDEHRGPGGYRSVKTSDWGKLAHTLCQAPWKGQAPGRQDSGSQLAGEGGHGRDRGQRSTLGEHGAGQTRCRQAPPLPGTRQEKLRGTDANPGGGDGQTHREGGSPAVLWMPSGLHSCGTGVGPAGSLGGGGGGRKQRPGQGRRAGGQGRPRTLPCAPGTATAPAALAPLRPRGRPWHLAALAPAPGHPLRGLSPGPPEPSLVFRRRLSIQLALGRVAKPDSASELSRMFLPDTMSSPKPSWWEKA